MTLDMFTIGQVFTTLEYPMTLEAITRFAAEFDPEYMHLDAEKAGAGRFGGIIASGMHTLAVSFKLWVETSTYGDEVIAGKQMNNVRFLKPVYPGDVLHVIAQITDIVATKQEHGLLTVLLSTYNDRDEKVLTCDVSALIKR
jgi:acyl dehydratase